MASPWVFVSSPIRWGLQRCWEVAVGLCPGQRVAQADLWPWTVRGTQVTAWGSQPGRPGSGSSPPLSRCGPQAGSMTLLNPGFLSGIINHPNLASLPRASPREVSQLLLCPSLPSGLKRLGLRVEPLVRGLARESLGLVKTLSRPPEQSPLPNSLGDLFWASLQLLRGAAPPATPPARQPNTPSGNADGGSAAGDFLHTVKS